MTDDEIESVFRELDRIAEETPLVFAAWMAEMEGTT